MTGRHRAQTTPGAARAAKRPQRAATSVLSDPVPRRSAVDDVASRLRREILSGALAPGAMFPPERELSQTLGVSRLTLRSAFARLVPLGLVRVRQGDGIRAENYRRQAGLEVLIELFGALDGKPAEQKKLLRGLLEVRLLMSCEAVVLACERRTRHDLRNLHAAIDAFEKATEHATSKGELRAAELDISYALVEAAGNLGFVLIQNTMVRFIDAYPQMVEANPVTAEARLLAYRMLATLIEGRKAAQAREAVAAALSAMDDRVVAEFDTWYRR